MYGAKQITQNNLKYSIFFASTESLAKWIVLSSVGYKRFSVFTQYETLSYKETESLRINWRLKVYSQMWIM